MGLRRRSHTLPFFFLLVRDFQCTYISLLEHMDWFGMDRIRRGVVV
jgi:hypothetical protein